MGSDRRSPRQFLGGGDQRQNNNGTGVPQPDTPNNLALEMQRSSYSDMPNQLERNSSTAINLVSGDGESDEDDSLGRDEEVKVENGRIIPNDNYDCIDMSL